MTSQLRNEEVDQIVQATMDSLSEDDRDKADQCVRNAVGYARDRCGNTRFGVKAARQVLIATALFLNKKP